jgi:hypothetical protein
MGLPKTQAPYSIFTPNKHINLNIEVFPVLPRTGESGYYFFLLFCRMPIEFADQAVIKTALTYLFLKSSLNVGLEKFN